MSAEAPGGDALVVRRVPVRILALVTFFVLLVGTVGAFATVQHLKRTGTIFDRLQVTHKFSPNGDGFKDQAQISFRLTRPDRADVEIIDSGGATVKVLAADTRLRDYFIHEFTWDGQNEDGEPAPVGIYRLVVRLEEQRRTITPTTIELHEPDV